MAAGQGLYCHQLLVAFVKEQATELAAQAQGKIPWGIYFHVELEPGLPQRLQVWQCAHGGARVC